jgi:hypothetical protein
MLTLPRSLRALSAVLLLTPWLAACADAQDRPEDLSRAGLITAVENSAEVVSATGSVKAIIGTPVKMKDELRTGPKARMQVTFRDNTVLTLGENATVVVDTYVYDPDAGTGEAVLQATRGAFRFVTGKIKDMQQKKVAVSTPVADIGIRGTEFWGGPIDAKYGILLLSGEVVVSNQAGSVTLKPGEGTDIPSPLDPPGAPKAWGADKIARAIESVALH